MKVFQAINAVAADLAKEGIAKDRKNTQQGYNFRGIDDVYGALSGLLAKHKLVILPRAMDRTVTERETKNGGALFYSVLRVEFDFISAEDGSKHTACTYGEAMDSGDKSTNKAMSAAYKYVCMQAFCIPTEGDNDADATTHELVAPGRGDKYETRPIQPHSAGPSPLDTVPVGKHQGKKWSAVTELYLQAVMELDDAPVELKSGAQRELERRDFVRTPA